MFIQLQPKVKHVASKKKKIEKLKKIEKNINTCGQVKGVFFSSVFQFSHIEKGRWWLCLDQLPSSIGTIPCTRGGALVRTLAHGTLITQFPVTRLLTRVVKRHQK